ncbi:IclR family transcriptional regulator [Streptomyces sp. NEAU-YJ-81]|uniref:IclR family transcriptional regulator n=1 Tax=Streptomyces sp. NEAU-YJ-81 TaxID=2820288 RepID=UPI001ABD3C62|nr:IclR family transcriptional regulator [Streptomyces sp. NEAU-YJ-81]MBO3682079.1 IclR family transcriptional regulator [Streptomyces sp. NEAU-YJ-81]
MTQAASPGGPAPPRGRRPAQGDAVIDRAFALLGAFEPTRQVLSLADLTHLTGMPRSTTLRLARKLVGAGALERREDGRYAIGLRLLEIASLAPRGHGLRAVAMPFMEDLFHITRRHVLLAVRDGDEALLVERLSAHDADPVLYRVGGRMPLHSTGVGLVLLAGAPPAVQERILGSLPTDPAGREVPDTAELRRVLSDVRRGGFATVTLSVPWPRTSVAAPILGPDRTVCAALSVVLPLEAADHKTMTPAVRTCARAISRELRSLPCQDKPALGDR